MLSQKLEALGWWGGYQLQKLAELKKFLKDYSTALARIFVGQQHGNATNKMCEEEK